MSSHFIALSGTGTQPDVLHRRREAEEAKDEPLPKKLDAAFQTDEARPFIAPQSHAAAVRSCRCSDRGAGSEDDFYRPRPAHPGAWEGDDFVGKRELLLGLQQGARERLLELVRRHRALVAEPWQLPRMQWQDERLQAALAPAVLQLRRGRGFALIGGLPVGELELPKLKLAYWILGAQFGAAQPQGTRGERIDEIGDTSAGGSDPARSRRATVLHTDACDMVALLAVRGARSGGVTSLASALTVHERLRAERPDLLARLYEGYRYHRRGEEAPGEEPITAHRVPVFSVTAGHLNLRYVRSYMETALKSLGERDPLLIEAFDRVERIARETAFSFTLAPGELLLLNNLTTLHARSACTDWDEPQRRRLLLRLSLNEPGFRPQAPELNLYGSGHGAPQRSGRNASFASLV